MIFFLWVGVGFVFALLSKLLYACNMALEEYTYFGRYEPTVSEVFWDELCIISGWNIGVGLLLVALGPFSVLSFGAMFCIIIVQLFFEVLPSIEIDIRFWRKDK